MITTDEILDQLEIMFPDAHCELIHKNPFELLVAVVLSAQTTDNAVNKVTPALFESFPDPKTMANADIKDIEDKIKRIGLYRNKARSIQNLSKSLLTSFDGNVPQSMKDLTSLAGVGRKTANVVRSVCFDIPSIAVDTHVERISKRLGFAFKKDSVLVVEQKLQKAIPQERWIKTHHQMIFFGRYHCKSINPDCQHCSLIDICKEPKRKKYLNIEKD